MALQMHEESESASATVCLIEPVLYSQYRLSSDNVLLHGLLDGSISLGNVTGAGERASAHLLVQEPMHMHGPGMYPVRQLVLWDCVVQQRGPQHLLVHRIPESR